MKISKLFRNSIFLAWFSITITIILTVITIIYAKYSEKKQDDKRIAQLYVQLKNEEFDGNAIQLFNDGFETVEIQETEEIRSRLERYFSLTEKLIAAGEKLNTKAYALRAEKFFNDENYKSALIVQRQY